MNHARRELGLRPKHRSAGCLGRERPAGSSGVWGRAPTGSGGRAASYILAAKPPRVWGGAPTPCVHDSIKPAGLIESSLARWAAVLGFVALTLGPFGLTTRALTAHSPNWIQTNLATTRRDKTGGLIESCTHLKRNPLSVYATARVHLHEEGAVWNCSNEEPARFQRFAGIPQHTAGLIFSLEGVMQGKLTAAEIKLRFGIRVFFFKSNLKNVA